MSSESDRSATYLSYMLRLWQAGSRGDQPVWRASLENPNTGECLAFGGVEALLAFLADKTNSQPGAAKLQETFGRTDSQDERTTP